MGELEGGGVEEGGEFEGLGEGGFGEFEGGGGGGFDGGEGGDAEFEIFDFNVFASEVDLVDLESKISSFSLCLGLTCNFNREPDTEILIHIVQHLLPCKPHLIRQNPSFDKILPHLHMIPDLKPHQFCRKLTSHRNLFNPLPLGLHIHSPCQIHLLETACDVVKLVNQHQILVIRKLVKFWLLKRVLILGHLLDS